MIFIMKGFEPRKGLVEEIIFSGQGAHLADPCVGIFFSLLLMRQIFFFFTTEESGYGSAAVCLAGTFDVQTLDSLLFVKSIITRMPRSRSLAGFQGGSRLYFLLLQAFALIINSYQICLAAWKMVRSWAKHIDWVKTRKFYICGCNFCGILAHLPICFALGIFFFKGSIRVVIFVFCIWN